MKLGKLYFTLDNGRSKHREFVSTAYKDRGNTRKRIQKYALHSGYKVSNFKYVTSK